MKLMEAYNALVLGLDTRPTRPDNNGAAPETSNIPAVQLTNERELGPSKRRYQLASVAEKRKMFEQKH